MIVQSVIVHALARDPIDPAAYAVLEAEEDLGPVKVEKVFGRVA
jgi:hypothetical protein